MARALREYRAEDRAACADLLASLPRWFGIQAANDAYVDRLSAERSVVIEDEGRVVAFLSVVYHNEGSMEIDVMGVTPTAHRQGLGRSLVAWVEDKCRLESIRWLHVKTRGPSTPDPDYEKTRNFYEALGFERLFESLDLWGPEDAALILVKRIEAPASSSSR